MKCFNLAPAESNSKLRLVFMYYIYAEKFQVQASTVQNHLLLFCVILQESNIVLMVCFVWTQRCVRCSSFYKMLAFEREIDNKYCKMWIKFKHASNLRKYSFTFTKFRKLVSILLIYDQSSNATSHINS